MRYFKLRDNFHTCCILFFSLILFLCISESKSQSHEDSSKSPQHSTTLNLQPNLGLIQPITCSDCEKIINRADQKILDVFQYCTLIIVFVTAMFTVLALFFGFFQSKIVEREVKISLQTIQQKRESLLIDLEKRSKDASHLLEQIQVTRQQLILSVEGLALIVGRVSGKKDIALEAHAIANRLELASENPVKRATALMQLAYVGYEQDFNTMLYLSENDPDQSVRASAIEAMTIWKQINNKEKKE
jgi:hypothetical protein